MNTGKGLKHQKLTGRIIRVFLDVYNELGAGFLESVYVEALTLALGQVGLAFEREMPFDVRFRGKVIGHFRADLVVGGTVLVEAKACPSLHQTHSAQVLNYLRATVLEVGLLLNFGPRPHIKRLVFDNSRKMDFKDACWYIDHRSTGGPRSDPFPSVSSVAPCSFSLAPPV